MIDAPVAIAGLRASCGAIHSLATGLSEEQARWKPTPEKWSILEVINHLGDEEVEDFRARIDVVLHHPELEFTPIDPPRWVIDRRYSERGLEESLRRFEEGRQRSLDWLAGLRDPDWTRSRSAPSGGTFTAGQLLASWVAHDLLHVRQITRLRYQWLESLVAPISLEYAGGW